MVRVVLERVYDSPFPTPMTLELWYSLKKNKLLGDCLKIHGVQGIQTLAACDGHRAICELEAPEAEVVRISCRTIDEPFKSVCKVYPQGIDPPKASAATDDGLACILVDSTWEPPITEARLRASLQQVAPYLEKNGAHWQRSLVSADGSRTLSTFKAPHAEAVEQAYQQAGISFLRLYPVDQFFPA